MKSHLIPLVFSFILNATAHARGFAPPLGIPDPAASFGSFDPIRTDRPNTTTHCPGWHESPPRSNTRAGGDVRDAYYVDKYHAAATDTSNPFGSPGRPRLTVPELLFAAGDYIEIHGDGDAATANPYTNPMRPRASGSDLAPVWFVGVNSPVMTSKLDIGYFSSSPYSYLVFDGIQWRGVNCDIRPRYDNNPISNLVIRDCVFKGGSAVADASGIAIGASSATSLGRTVKDVVIHNTEISHYGDWNSPGEEMGINLASQVSGFWVIDCNIHDVAEDGIQLGHGALRSSDSIYIGRCAIHDNLTNALDFKGIGGPVIVSQCRIWGHEDVWIDGVHKSTGMGQSATFHYAGSSSGPRNYLNHPEDVSFLFNRVEGSRMSIRTSSCGRLRIIGNILLKTRRLPTGYTDNPKAIEIGGVKGDSWICHNTFYDCEGGIQVWDAPALYSPATTYYRSSIVSYDNRTMLCVNDNGDVGITGIAPSDSSHWREIRLRIFGNIISNTYNNAKDIEFASQQYLDNSVDAGFNCIYNTSGPNFRNYALHAGDITADPLFADPMKGSFWLLPASLCIDASGTTGVEVYNDYFQRFGIDVRRDFNGGARPKGDFWDIGAYEYGSNPLPAPKGVGVSIPEQ